MTLQNDTDLNFVVRFLIPGIIVVMSHPRDGFHKRKEKMLEKDVLYFILIVGLYLWAPG